MARGVAKGVRRVPRISRTTQILLASLLGGVLFYLAMRGVTWSEALGVMSDMRLWPLALALALILGSPLVRAWRWKELYEQESPGFWRLVHAVVAGQTLNFALPFRSGDVARVLMVGGPKLPTAGTVAFEKVLDAAFFATLCISLPLVWAVPGWLEGPRISVTVMAAIYLAAVLFIAFVTPHIPRLPKIVHIPRLGQVPRLAATTLFLGASGIAVNDLVLRSLHIQAPLMASVVLLVILQAGVAVPSTPGRLGVFQYLAVLGLSLFGVAHTEALAFGLVLHILVFVPTALIAGAFLMFTKKQKHLSSVIGH
jgi:uncharacterized membrane protein YbhN (UPF0104 family)